MAVLPLRAAAPAKLNLDLYVTGREEAGPRAGYHRLDSLVVFLDLADMLEATPAEGLTLAVDGPFGGDLDSGDGDSEENLVLRAARLLASRAGPTPGAALRLTKNIPVAAGLGGGSADAAAALRLLAHLWDVDVTERDLAKLGLQIGADVPVCLHGRPAVMRGIGELLGPAPELPPGLAVVLANPRVPLSTVAVFGSRQGGFSVPPDARADPAAGRNDLQSAAATLVPEIGDMLGALAALPGALAARLSGSGPTGFALFADVAAARQGAASLSTLRPEWWVCAAVVAGGVSSG